MIRREIVKGFDWILAATVVIIFSIGLLFLYSSTCQLSYKFSSFLPQGFVPRQLLWFLLGSTLGLAVLAVDYKKWLEMAYFLYVFNLLLLILVLVLGEVKLGAQRWLRLGIIGFQPSEFSKLIIILALARFLGESKTGARQKALSIPYIKKLFFSFLIVGIPCVLIIQQPDLGTALTLIPLLLAMLFVWGMRLKNLIFILATSILASPLLWQLLKDYQKRRILVFFNPNVDPLGAGYTVIQSKIAIGSGGLFGKGWLAGTQNQLNFLPERHTDFIFSVVGEEWGFAGALLLLLLYMFLLWRAFSIAQRTGHLAGRLLICGIIAMLSFQIVVNISMTMGLVPAVGLPLPLISYGGSSLLTTLISLALILNVGRRRNVLF